jgi:hypothetical protein
MAGKVGVQDEFLDPVGSRIEQNILGRIPKLVTVELGKANKLRSLIQTNTPYSYLTDFHCQNILFYGIIRGTVILQKYVKKQRRKTCNFNALPN